MKNILLMAKLQHPRPVRGYVERKALEERLGQSGKRLMVFHANMGFGKTMFMSGYAQKCGVPFLWYHLDRQDNDRQVFLNYLREGIRESLGENGGDWAGEIADGQTAAAALNRLDGPFLLMLDDFQEIEQEEIFELLDIILKNTRADLRVFLTTKGPLPRFVNRHVLEGTAAVIGSEELAFSREEAFQLLAAGRPGGMDEDVAEAVYRYTEGWPAGVMFLHLYERQERVTVSREQMLKICQEYMVHDYIMYELFRKLPFDLQEFLKKTSVLEYLDSQSCNAVAGIQNASGQLRYLVQENLFVQRTEGSFAVYRYHSMFRDFLQSQLTREEKAELCGRAAVGYLGNGQPQQALEYALMSRSLSMVKLVLEKVGFGLLEDGRYVLLAEALDWYREQGKAVPACNRVLEAFVKLRTETGPGGEEAVLELVQDAGIQKEDRRLYERLVRVSAETCLGRGSDRMAGRILEAAMEQEGLSAERWHEYMTARIFCELRLGRLHQAQALYGRMTGNAAVGMPPGERGRRRVRQMRRVALELSGGWRKAAKDGGAEPGDMEGGSSEAWESWWLSEEERRLADGLRRMAWEAAGSGESAGEAGASLCSGEGAGETGVSACSGEPAGPGVPLEDAGLAGMPEWMEAVSQTARGLALFKAGSWEEGCRLGAAGAAVLKRYPWLSLPVDDDDKRLLLWMGMLAGNSGAEAFPHHLFINCFGSFRMTVMETGEEVRFRTNKAKACMAYLYHMGQPVDREQIIKALWNDVEELPANEVAALHNIFSTLRKSLSPFGLEDIICYEDKKYFLKPGALFSSAEGLRAFLHAADTGDTEGLLWESGMCGLYEGSYFQDIGGVWCVEERAWFDRKLGEAFFALARIYQQEGDYEACLGLLGQAEELTMLREPVNLCVIDCCVALKDGNRLKSYYKRLKRYCLEFTGEEPGERVRRRYLDGLKLCGKV